MALNTKIRALTFLAVAVTSLAVHFLTFELRYMWYLDASNASFLRIGYAASLVVIIALWIMFPSSLIVAATAVVSFIFPPMLRRDVFISIDWEFLGFILISLSLLIAATELRRRLNRTASRSGKIKRRILHKIAQGQYDSLGDVSTLADPQVVNEIIAERKRQQDMNFEKSV